MLDVNWKKSFWDDATKTFEIHIKGKRDSITDRKELAKALILSGTEITDAEKEASETIAQLPTKKSKDQNAKPEMLVVESEELNQFTADLFWWLKFCHVDRQNKKWLIKTYSDGCEYTVLFGKTIQDMVTVLQHIKMPTTERKSLYEVVKKSFRDNWGEKISFYKDYVKENSSGQRIMIIPTLVEYLEQNIERFQASTLCDIDIQYDNIKLLSNSPKEHCFNFIDLKKIDKNFGTPTPHTEFWLESFFTAEQIKVFRAYIYGIFREDFKSRQAVYIEDINGKTGKSTFIRALQNYINSISSELVVSFNSKAMTKEFAYAPFFNKRLAIDADLKNPNIFHTELFHKVSGGDPCSIERKGQEPFTAVLHCKCILVGNIKVDISTVTEHERSRIIYLKMGRATEEYLLKTCVLNEDKTVQRDSSGSHRYRPDHHFEQYLRDEMPAFVANSRKYYEALSNGGEIFLHDELHQDLANNASSSIDEFFTSFLEGNFIVTKNEEDFVESSEFYILFKNEYRLFSDGQKDVDYKFSDFKKIIEIVHGVKSVQKRVEGHRKRGFIGLKKRTVTDAKGF